jgi:LPS-assembly protein
MSDRVVKGISVGAFFYALLIVGSLIWGPLSDPAVAKVGLTVGFAVDGSGLVAESKTADQLARYLEEHLSLPVKVRSFSDEQQLYSWITRYGEVDIAWLSRQHLSGVPSGEVIVLVRNLDHSPGPLQGGMVVRQGLSPALRQQLSTAFLDMNRSPKGRTLLAELGISRFVPSQLWQNRAWADAAESEEQAAEQRRRAPQRSEPSRSASQTGATAAVSPVVGSPAVEAAEPEAPAPETPAPETPALETPNAAAGAAVPMGRLDQQKSVSLVADSLAYNSSDGSYEASGDVVMSRDDVVLKAGHLLWQEATQDAAAEGDVQLQDAEAEMSGDTMRYNVATGQGQVSNGRVLIRKDNFHLAGAEIEKRGQAEYFVKKGHFTTCDGEIPDWSFTADEVDLTVGGYARAKHVWFRVRDVPLLYTPYLAFPVKAERETGLLTPWFGYSDHKGMTTSLAWYQVIDRNQDATIYLDYLSEIGLGTGLEYRYALAGHNQGEALYYHVAGVDETPESYYLSWQHRGSLPGDWTLTADIQYADRKVFYEEFGEVADEYNNDRTISTLMLARNWQKLNLVGNARFIKDLDSDNESTLQRLPELGLGLARYRLAQTPLYVGLESYATRFQREDGEDGNRLYLKPTLSATFRPGSWLEITPQLALHQRYYDAEAPDKATALTEFSLTLSSQFVRTFDLNRFGIERIRHSVEPTVTYSTIQNRDQDELPSFDQLDRIEDRELVSYALVNRLTTRATAEDGSESYNELLNLRLSQAYDLDEARNNNSGKDQPLSDLRLEMLIEPSRFFSLDVDGRIPMYGGDSRFFRSLTVGARAADDTGNAVRLDYTYRDESYDPDGTDYVRMQLDTPLLKPVYARFEERYDFRSGRELEKVVGLEYRARCWSLLLTYRNRYRQGEDSDHEFMINFVLAGFGWNQGFGNGFGAIPDQPR